MRVSSCWHFPHPPQLPQPWQAWASGSGPVGVSAFRLQQGKGQADIQVDGHKIVSGSHRRFLLNFL